MFRRFLSGKVTCHRPLVTLVAFNMCPIRLVTSASTANPRPFDYFRRSSLHLAALEGNDSKMKKILNNSEDQNILKATDINGDTVLHAAAQSGNVHAVEMLIAMGCDVKALGERRRSPLHYAAECGNLNVIETLIEAGNDALEERDTRNKTPLQYAVMSGNLQTITFFLERSKYPREEIVKIRDCDENTLLHLAAAKGGKEVIEMLVKIGVDATLTNRRQRSALHLAAESGNALAVKALLSIGCDPKTKDNAGATPLDLAVISGSAETIGALLDSGCDPNAIGYEKRPPLHHAATIPRSFGTAGLETLIAKGANVHAVDSDGNTALHEAASSGNLTSIKVLFAKGSDIKAENNYGVTPLHNAAKWGCVETVEFLCANGADAAARTKQNQTPLHFATFGCNCAAMELLVAKGCPIDAVDSTGFTPLLCAAEFDISDAVEQLILLGCDVNAVDKDGGNALHRTCNSYRWDHYGRYYKDDESSAKIVEKLVASGCDTTKVDNSGETPLECAKRRGLEEAVKILTNKSHNK